MSFRALVLTQTDRKVSGAIRQPPSSNAAAHAAGSQTNAAEMSSGISDAGSSIDGAARQ